MTVTWDTTKIRHGTPSGFSLHQKLDERPCDACYAAKQAYDRRWRAAPDITRRHRLKARAQNRAERRLAALYPDTYRDLYEEEKAKLAAEHGVAL